MLEGDPAVFSAGDPVLPFAAGVLHQRRGHRWSDADRRRGGRCQRYQFSGVHLFAVRLRRQRRLLRHHVLLCGHARRTGRAPLAGHAAAAVRRADGGADGAGAGAAGSHAGVDQRDARPPRGVHRGAHLLRHHLRRYRRTAVLQLYLLLPARHGRFRDTAAVPAVLHGAERRAGSGVHSGVPLCAIRCCACTGRTGASPSWT